MTKDEEITRLKEVIKELKSELMAWKTQELNIEPDLKTTDPSKQEDYDNYKADIENSINFIMKEWDLKWANINWLKN